MATLIFPYSVKKSSIAMMKPCDCEAQLVMAAVPVRHGDDRCQ